MGRPISRRELLAELKRLRGEVGETPSQSDMNNLGQFSPGPYTREFGSWNTAIREAGFEPHQDENISDEQLLVDLRRFAQEIGGTPTVKEMDKAGPHSRSRYSNRFGSWNNAIERAGLNVNQEKDLSDELLIEELVEFTEQIGKTPSSEEMKEDGPRSSVTYINRFGSWNDALRQADLTPLHEVDVKEERECDQCGSSILRAPSHFSEHNFCSAECLSEWRSDWITQRNRIGSEMLLQEIRRLADSLDKVPSANDMKAEGKFSVGPFQREFGSWLNALEKAGYSKKSRFRERNHGIERSALLEALKKLGKSLEVVPTSKDMSTHGMYSPNPYFNEFGTWGDALEAAGFNPEDRTFGGIARKELIEEIERLAEEIEDVPTTEDMITFGKFSIGPFRREFGSWSTALEESGFTPKQRKNLTIQNLSSELIRISQIVGRPPVTSDIRDLSEYSVATYLNHFGTMRDARKRAGLPEEAGSPGSRVDKDDLIIEIQNVADKIGHAPSRDELAEVGQYSRSPYERVFGSVAAAREAAGLPYKLPSRKLISDDDLLSEIHRLSEIVEHTPTIEDLRTYGQYSYPVYRRAYGSWNEALSVAGYEPNKLHDVRKEQIVAEIQRLCDELGQTPSATDMKSSGRFGVTTIVQRFGSWNNAIIAAGFDPNTQPSGEDHPNWKDGKRTRRKYGRDWYKTRERIIDRDGQECVTCGLGRQEHKSEFGADLHVHHRKPAKEFDRRGAGDFDENLVTLCASCHSWWEQQSVQPQVY